jgi:hypothetical protein
MVSILGAKISYLFTEVSRSGSPPSSICARSEIKCLGNSKQMNWQGEIKQLELGLTKQSQDARKDLKAQINAWKETEKEEKKGAELDAEEIGLWANLVAVEALQRLREADAVKQKAKLAAEEVRSSIESENGGQARKKATSAANVISPDSRELISGSVTLVFNLGPQSNKILQLANSLQENSKARKDSSGRSAGMGSWVRLIIPDPVPLYHLLYDSPFVQEVTVKDNEIQVKMLRDE